MDIKKITPVQIGISIASLVVLTVGSYFGYTAYKAGKEDKPAGGKTNPSGGNTNTGTPDTPSKPEPGEVLVGEKVESSKFPLKLGGSGKYVVYLQAAINFKEGNIVSVDGKFGQEVRDALYKHYDFYSAFMPFVTFEITIKDFNDIVPMKNQKFLQYMKQYSSVLAKYK